MNRVAWNDEQIARLFLIEGFIDKKSSGALMHINELITIMQMVGQLSRRAFFVVVDQLDREEGVSEERLAIRIHAGSLLMRCFPSGYQKKLQTCNLKHYIAGYLR